MYQFPEIDFFRILKKNFFITSDIWYIFYFCFLKSIPKLQFHGFFNPLSSLLIGSEIFELV